MSWQAYVDSSLVGSGHIAKAAIVSAAGDSTWAISPNFEVKPDELRTIVAALNARGDTDAAPVSKVLEEGIYVNGERYVITRIEGNHIYARKLKMGVVIVKTNQAILIGQYGEDVQAGNATQTVEALADYLVSSGY
ncbi:profilin, required for normal timing of actin polymerization in response to thermal stress [Collariella sp. IMI 366227]|nr:profilin, required for normal timing of actin polymerization in response to thermal stress [Collariella sp. IMI 366227]